MTEQKQQHVPSAIDKTELTYWLEEAGKLNSSDYTKDGWDIFRQIVTEATGVKDDATATEHEVSEAVIALIDGMIALEKEKVYTVTVDGKKVAEGVYNQIVTITADASQVGQKFAGWQLKDKINMYEQSIDENGIEKKNYVDDMAGVDSGGEGQNPKYVALLAGFAMLYMQQSNRDSKIRLVLLDEAFSKMDKERSEVCLKYARELELQLIVCVPDERLQSLIRNVDSVYGFRRFRNQVTMMHIDKGNYLDMIAGESRSEEV